MIPGKIIPKYKSCFVPYEDREHRKNDFEVLCGSGFKWVVSLNGNVPKGAVEGGKTVTGEALFVARAQHLDTVTPGKVHGSHRCMFLS